MDFQYRSVLVSDMGRFIIGSSQKGITSIRLSEEKIDENESHHTFLCRSELLDYFDGRLKSFTVSIDISNGTPFHQKVWNHLLQIPYGKTVSYMSIALALDNPKAIRAVGRANGLNPIPFIVPCHRVIGSDGSLTGYAMGVDMKAQLLAMENPKAYPVQQRLF